MANVWSVLLAALIVAACGKSAGYQAFGWTVAIVCGMILLATLLAGAVFGIEAM